jgi:hypothetical protein
VLTGPDELVVGLEALFDGSGSHDGQGGIKNWAAVDSTGRTQQEKTKGAPGAFPVTIDQLGPVDVVLTVWDARGTPGTATKTVNVVAAPVPCILAEPVLALAGSWGPCQPSNTRTRLETWARDVVSGGSDCVSVLEDRIGEEACVFVPLPPTGGGNAWYEKYRDTPACVAFFSLRDQASLDVLPRPTDPTAKPLPLLYDSTLDAARCSWVPTITPNIQQKILPLPQGLTSLLHVHDFRFDEGWAYDPAGDDGGASGDEFTYGRKTYYRDGVPPGKIAAVRMTTQKGPSGLPPGTTTVAEEMFPKLANLVIDAHKWVRLFELKEDLNQLVTKISLWAWQEGAPAPIHVYDRIGFFTPVNGWKKFRIEFNASPTCTNATSPHEWERNHLFLAGYTPAMVTGILEAPLP